MSKVLEGILEMWLEDVNLNTLQVHTDRCLGNRGSSEMLAGWREQGAQSSLLSLPMAKVPSAYASGGFGSRRGREAPYVPSPHPSGAERRLAFLSLLGTKSTGVGETSR